MLFQYLLTKDIYIYIYNGIISVQSLSCVWLLVIPWTAAHQASLSITNSWSLLKFISKSVMPSNHLILCYPLLLLPSIFTLLPESASFPLSQFFTKVLEFQHQSFQWIFRTNFLCNRILLSYRKEWNFAICSTMDGLWRIFYLVK